MNIFLTNKYTNIYYALVERAKSRKLTCYKENHHIIPKCFYEGESESGWLKGDCDKNNTVDLTAREHFIAHWLLIKMQPNEVQRAQMVFAFNMMSVYGNHQKRYETAITSRAYEKYRIEHAKNISEMNAGKEPWNKGQKEERQEVLDNVKAAARKRDAVLKTCEHCGRTLIARAIKQYHGDKCEKNPNKDPNMVTVKTRGKKRTKKQKENIRKGSLEFYKENPRGPMPQTQKDAISASTIGVPKPKKQGKTLSATVKKQREEGTHSTQIKVSCIKTRKVYSLSTFARYVLNANPHSSRHGENCKSK